MASPKTTSAITPVERVQSRILLIRGQRVIIDGDLARLYGVTTKRLNEQVKRNPERFPEDFMFQLTWEEAEILRSQFATLRLSTTESALKSHFATSDAAPFGEPSRSQFATLSAKHGQHIKYRPYAFTEHGAIMAANVLSSPDAIKASVFVVRAFVKLRELLSTHVQLAHKLEELERKLSEHDQRFALVFDAIRELMEEPEDPPKPPIGFHTELNFPRKALARKRSPK